MLRLLMDVNVTTVFISQPKCSIQAQHGKSKVAMKDRNKLKEDNRNRATDTRGDSPP